MGKRDQKEEGGEMVLVKVTCRHCEVTCDMGSCGIGQPIREGGEREERGGERDRGGWPDRLYTVPTHTHTHTNSPHSYTSGNIKDSLVICVCVCVCVCVYISACLHVCHTQI